MGTAGIMRDAAQPIRGSRTRTNFAAVAGVFVATLFGTSAAKAAEMSSAVAYLYSSVSIYPPSAKSMTVCYGFVCRRREILDFTAADRSAITQIMAAGRASAAAERAAVQKVVVWFDRRMIPDTAAIHWCCRRRTTPRCWSIAPPRSSGSSISGRAAICSHPM
jgi:hypothetical protein